MANIDPRHSSKARDICVLRGIAMKHYTLNTTTIRYVQNGGSSWDFEISECVLRNQTLMIRLDTFSVQMLNIWAPFRFISVIEMTVLLKCAKFQKRLVSCIKVSMTRLY